MLPVYYPHSNQIYSCFLDLKYWHASCMDFLRVKLFALEQPIFTFHRYNRIKSATLKHAAIGRNGEDIMSTYYRDLCSTCNHAQTCGVRRTRSRPVFYCEEFDSYVRVSAPQSSKTKPKKEMRPATYHGLCSDCENRTSCSVSRSTEGVWHCEEYR